MYLALDLGSTHVKAAVFGADLGLLGQHACPVATRCEPGGVVEVDVAAAADALRLAIDGARTAAAPDAAAPLRAMAITSQAQTFAVTTAGGALRTAFISWQDARATQTAAELARQPALAAFAEHASFGELLPGLQICLLHHLRTRPPGPVAPHERVLPLPAWAAAALSGEEVLDRNLAAMSGLYSLRSDGWWPPALAACGLTTAQLPRLVDTGAVAARTGPTAAAFGLPVGLPLVLAGNDQTAGAYGARLHESAAVLVTLGTAQVAYTCRASLPPAAPGTVRGPYPGGRFYRMAADSCGGNVVTWAANVLTGADYARFFDLAGSVPARTAPRFEAEVAAGAGAWSGLGLHHGPGHLARAVLESLCDRLAALVRGLDTPPGTRILVAGGGSRQPAWRSLLQARLGVPLEVTDADPLLGAARLAREALSGR